MLELSWKCEIVESWYDFKNLKNLSLKQRLKLDRLRNTLGDSNSIKLKSKKKFKLD